MCLEGDFLRFFSNIDIRNNVRFPPAIYCNVHLCNYLTLQATSFEPAHPDEWCGDQLHWHPPTAQYDQV